MNPHQAASCGLDLLSGFRFLRCGHQLIPHLSEMPHRTPLAVPIPIR